MTDTDTITKNITTLNAGRIRRALARLRAVLRAHPEVRVRTARYLAGELPGTEDDSRGNP